LSESRKIAWISQALPTGPLHEGLQSHIASIRYRTLIPARELQRRGIENVIISPEADARSAEQLRAGRSAALIGKLSLFDPQAVLESARAHLALAARAQSLGIRVIADVCEDRFDHKLLGGYWKDMVRTADRIVTSTTQLAELVRRAGAQDVEIVPDPVEGRGDRPRFQPGSKMDAAMDKSHGDPIPLRILWFGHQSNLDEVQEFLPDLDRWVRSRSKFADFNIVTAAGFGAENFVTERKTAGSGLRIQHVVWTLGDAEDALQDCDLVIIPATLQNSRKRSKSANRVTESLHAGRYVLAHPVPSYLEFADYAWIGDDLFAGLDWALAHPDSVVEQIRAGQNFIRQTCLPAEIASRWEVALDLAKATI
jgi:hypothetical protein